MPCTFLTADVASIRVNCQIYVTAVMIKYTYYVFAQTEYNTNCYFFLFVILVCCLRVHIIFACCGDRNGAVVRAIVSHQCVLGLIPGSDVIYVG